MQTPDSAGFLEEGMEVDEIRKESCVSDCLIPISAVPGIVALIGEECWMLWC